MAKKLTQDVIAEFYAQLMHQGQWIYQNCLETGCPVLYVGSGAALERFELFTPILANLCLEHLEQRCKIDTADLRARLTASREWPRRKAIVAVLAEAMQRLPADLARRIRQGD
ncbi:hypothetical protein SAMN02745129_2578 [Ferrimonas marina]|uniref:Uncharacterized protein n=1 Tax=Ferrimonas marina TaxID=299255 RepID=A0A1M5UHU3_9GAMM|nr:hypothetical protein SAMN02745129_2578 [Ferrimonas marina]